MITAQDAWGQELQDWYPAVYRALERSRGRFVISEMPETYRLDPDDGHSRNGLTKQLGGPLDYWIMYNPTRSPDEILRALPHEPLHALYGVKHSGRQEADPATRWMRPPPRYAQQIASRLDPAMLATLTRDGITDPQELAVWAMAENIIIQRARGGHRGEP